MTEFLKNKFSRPWFAVFIFLVLVNVIGSTPSGTNPRSRMAALYASCEIPNQPIQDWFSIDDYVEKGWTIDWAQAPNGHYYTNKAPAPIILGALLYCPFQNLMSFASEESKFSFQEKTRNFLDLLVSILIQVLPLFFLARFFFKSNPFSDVSLLFLLGNTVVLLANTQFGHAFSAVLLGAFIAFMFEKKFYWSGLCLGLFLLSDYAAPFAFPGMLILAWLELRKQNWKLGFIKLGLGFIPSLVFWLLYHKVTLGSAFNLPQAFNNPIFLDLKEEGALYGVLRLTPSPSSLLKLLFGTERGLLFTQPWILLTIGFGFKYFKTWSPRNKNLFVSLNLILGAFLFFNASFGQWHGGASPGPRYLSPVLPFFALIVLNNNPTEKLLFKISAGFSLMMNLLIMSTTRLLPQKSLYLALYDETLTHTGSVCLRFSLISFTGILLYLYQKKRIIP